MQQILGLQFYCSSFQVVKFFLDSSKDVLYQVTTLNSGISGFKFSGIFEKLWSNFFKISLKKKTHSYLYNPYL